MSLFIREDPLNVRKNNSLLNDPFFGDMENELFHHPLIPFPSLYPYYYTHPVDSLENQISKTFDGDVFKSVDFRPNINLSEDDKRYYIHADLPGMTKDQIKMELSDEDRILTISGERKTVIDHSKDNENYEGDEDNGDNENNENNENEKKDDKETSNRNTNTTDHTNTSQENNKKYSKIECNYGKFERSFSIPENADMDSIKAKMENGVLEVILNKIEPSTKEQTRSIQIQ
ncbi:HSP20-like chaperone [Neocallimastix lanati (nom. inval.)]|nr:HSP20-like chaperone [Neocallimastix sp. JGI-2020a]